MKQITFAEQKMMLHPQGLMFWPAEKLAIVSDLHLEKASYYAERGQYLPPHDSFETLQLLLEILKQQKVDRVVLLGDSFHDRQGYERLNEQSHALFDQLCKNYQIIWILGNHDKGFIPCDVNGYEEYKIQNITFRHEAMPEERQPEISGHFHPKLKLKLKDRKVSRSCLVEDGQRMIMPAFGAFTGGMDIQENLISILFKDNFCVHMLGKEKVYSVTSDKINKE